MSSTRYDGRPVTRRAVLARAGRASAALASAGLMAEIAAACGSDSDDASDGNAVRMWSQAYGDAKHFSAFVDKETGAWNDKGAGQIRWDIIPWTNAVQKWSLAMTNGSVPDVGDMFFLQSRVVQGRGKWGPLDITDEVEAGRFGDFSRYVPVAQREAEHEGRIYGIPWRIDSRAFVHNGELLPQAPKTLEELEAIAGELVAANKLKAAGLTFGDGQPYQHLKTIGAMWGVEYLSDDLGRSLLEDERWLEACLWVQDAIKRKILLPEACTNLKFLANDAMFTKSVAFFLGGIESVLPAAEGTAPQMVEHLRSSAMPVGPSGKSTGTTSSAQFSVFQNSKARDASLAWLEHLADPDFALRLAKITGQESADTVVQDEQITDFRRAFLASSRTAIGIDQPTPVWAQLVATPEGPLAKLAIDVYSMQDARTALKEAHEATTAILRRA